MFMMHTALMSQGLDPRSQSMRSKASHKVFIIKAFDISQFSLDTSAFFVWNPKNFKNVTCIGRHTSWSWWRFFMISVCCSLRSMSLCLKRILALLYLLCYYYDRYINRCAKSINALTFQCWLLVVRNVQIKFINNINH